MKLSLDVLYLCVCVTTLTLTYTALVGSSPANVHALNQALGQLEDDEIFDMGMGSKYLLASKDKVKDKERHPGSVRGHCGRGKYEMGHKMLYGEGWRGPAVGAVRKRVVGGRPSRTGEWPWLVSMQLNRSDTTSEYEHLCGGSLIAPQWVLTAAHCFESIWADFLTDNPDAWLARIGEHNLFTDDVEHVDIKPEAIILHPDRQAPESHNLDIALVKLSEPVALTNNVNVVCLPYKHDYVQPGTICVTAGWGHTEEDGNVSDVVRHVRLPIIGADTCGSFYEKIASQADFHITSDMMCAGYDEGGMDACQYDSGGPLVCYNQADSQWILTGIVSTGYGCARAGFPGIYTKVSEFIGWIEEITATY